MNQTFALLLDAYRELNAKWLFWITLVISGILVAIFAALGNNERGLTVLTWTLDIPWLSTNFIPAEEFHKLYFVHFGLKLWLTWIAMILALVSTASIFPDFLAGGAIELTLSKPIGRLRLFMTKYVAGLLFVGMQVGIFAFASFLVIGFRGGGWIPAIFLAVPIVVLVFSYLFSISVLIGTLWRSTIAALMLTLLAWGLVFVTDKSELGLLLVKTGMEEGISRRIEHIDSLKQTISETQARVNGDVPAKASEPQAAESGRPKEGGLLAGLKWALKTTDGEGTSDEARLNELRKRVERLETRLGEIQGTMTKVQWWYSVVFGLKTSLPKTSETTALMERYIIDLGKLEQLQGFDDEPEQPDFNMETGEDDLHVDEDAVGRKMHDAIQSRTEWWVIGTSLAFEACVLGIAAWVFCRRDF